MKFRFENLGPIKEADLEQCGAAVDLIGHRLLPVRYIDAKAAR